MDEGAPTLNERPCPPAGRTSRTRPAVRRTGENGETALGEVDALAESLDRYHLFHATRARLLGQCGRHQESRAALERALALAENPAERALLERRRS